MLVLRMFEGEEGRHHIVVVTRWLGGKHLGRDRFRHVQEALRISIRDSGTVSRAAAALPLD